MMNFTICLQICDVIKFIVEIVFNVIVYASFFEKYIMLETTAGVPTLCLISHHMSSLCKT